MNNARNPTSRKTGWIWLLVGVIVGAIIPASGLQQLIGSFSGTTDGNPVDATASEQHDDHENVIALSDTARWNLGLRTGRVKVKPFTQTIELPGVVRERPGLSDLAVSSRVHGVVTHILAQPGQAIRVGQPLFRMRLTGDQLATAQSSLLDIVQQITTVEAQIELVESAAKSGGVPANRLRSLKYDLDRLELNKRNRKQELMVRGLTKTQVDDIVATKSFLREITVGMHDMVKYVADTVLPEPDESFEDGLNFTVEELQVHLGMAVKPGDELAHVAYHTSLYFEGQAFEKDVDLLRTITRDKRAVSVAFGTEVKRNIEPDLQVVHIDNHVNPETQTIRFYIPIRNQVLGDTRTGDTTFRSWRFKPGQRGHVLIPMQTINDNFALPREAIVIEGPDAFVFREVKHDHSSHSDKGGHDHHGGKEFETVPVQVLLKTEQTAVISAGQALKAGDRIAMNRAYDLQLAMKSSDAPAHSHDHPH